MTQGIVLIIVGIFGLFLNTVILISYNIKMRKENEMAFITLRGLREPKTSKIVTRKTITMEHEANEIDKIIMEEKKKSKRKNIGLEKNNDDEINIEDTVYI